MLSSHGFAFFSISFVIVVVVVCLERPLQIYRDKNNNMNDVLCKSLLKAYKNSRKKSIRIAMATTNIFICENEIK